MPRAPSTSSRRALTIAEAVVTVFMVALVFGLAGDLMSDASRVVRFGNAKNRSLLGIQLGLNRMATEAREAFEIEEPTSGSSSELRFLKVDPTAPRFAGDPATWNPTANRLRVRYYSAGGNLIRQVGSQSEVVAEGLNGLSCDWTAEGNLHLVISIDENQRIRTFETEVCLPSVH